MITAFNIPSQFQPAYNPLYLTFDSDEKTQIGFRYVLRVVDSLANEIARLSIAPRVGDGIGYADVSDIAQSLVSYYNPTALGLFNDGWEDAVTTLTFHIGEEYQEPYTYTTVQQNGLYVELVGSSVPTYVAGDQINIAQSDGGSAMPQLEGLFTVVSVSGNDVTVSCLWSSITPAVIGGEVSYADGRKTQYLDQFDEQIDIHNSAFSFVSFKDYDPTDWQLVNGQQKSILTTCPRSGMRITPTQDMFFKVYGNTLTGNQYKVNIKTINPSGEFTYVVDANEAGQYVRVCGDLTGATVVSGSLPAVQDTTTRLDFKITDLANNPVSESFSFNIDHRCAINDYEVLFLDKLGSWGSFPFYLKRKINVTKQDKTYEKQLGTIDISGFSYELTDVGEETYNVQQNETIELNTNYLTEEESTYFAELITSPKTYIKVDGVYIACKVLTTEIEKDSFQNRRLIRKTITVKYSTQDTVNI
jgi:hypothetical protein